jgi:RNA polymerase sigma-70 factor (ECF subfamily)
MTPRLLAELVAAHAPALALYARTWCAAPDDVVQEAFCRLAGLRAAPDDPVAWLYRATRNAAVDLGRAERRRKRREESAARPDRWFVESSVDGLDAADAVAALERLPAEQREVIVARLWGGLTLEQAAAAGGCAVSTAFRRYEAGLAALRASLGVRDTV